MITHIVLLNLPANHDNVELRAIMAALDRLRSKIDGFTHFRHGPNQDFEGMSPHCTYGFVCHFSDEDTARTYNINPDHKALGARLVAMCTGGVDGITVIDLDTA